MRLGLTPDTAVTFDLTQDLPDNIIVLANGEIFHPGNFMMNDSGKLIDSAVKKPFSPGKGLFHSPVPPMLKRYLKACLDL